jgi:hypothetical protein
VARRGRTRKEGHAGEARAGGQRDVGREVAVERAGADGGDPRRGVGDRGGGRAGVARRAGDEHAGRRGAERAHGHGVAEVGRRAAAEGEREHAHAVGQGGVDAGEDVGGKAPFRPAHLVRGHARAGRHPARRPSRVPEEAPSPGLVFHPAQPLFQPRR